MSEQPPPTPVPTNKFEYLNFQILYYNNIQSTLQQQKAHLLKQVKLITNQLVQCGKEVAFIKEIIRDYGKRLRK